MKVSLEAQKKIDDRRQLLKNGVIEKGGKWDEAWIVDGVPRTTGVNSGRLDMYYISPDGKRMRSMSEVYSFLGLTAAPPKSSGPAPTAAHVAAAAATAASSGRGVREAKLSASAAITASATNPYPAGGNTGPMSGQKRGRGVATPAQQRGLREEREAQAQMAAVEPQRWRARLFPIDARARAAVDAYDQSLRESTVVDWRRSHNTSVKDYAGRVKPIVERAELRCMEEALRTEKQCAAVAEVFPVLRTLVSALPATGAHEENVKRATAALATCEAHHRTFSKDQINSVATLALTLSTLKYELASASTEGDGNTDGIRKKLPSAATIENINNARLAAHTAAGVAGNPKNNHDVASGRSPVTATAAATASAAASAAAAQAALSQGKLPPRHSNRPTPPLGSFAAAATASQYSKPPRTFASPSPAQVPSPAQAANGTKRATGSVAGQPALPPKPAELRTTVAAATPIKAMLASAPAAPAATAAPQPTVPARSPPTADAGGDPVLGAKRSRPPKKPLTPDAPIVSEPVAGAEGTKPARKKRNSPTATATATAAPSAASTQTRSTPTKPSSTSPTAPPAGTTAPQATAAAPAAAAAAGGSPQQGWPKFGSSDFVAAPIVSVRAPNGMLKGRLGNPSVCAHADGSLATASGSALPPADAVHYIFTLDGVAGKFAGAGASREERTTVGGESCRSTGKHTAVKASTETQPGIILSKIRWFDSGAHPGADGLLTEKDSDFIA